MKPKKYQYIVERAYTGNSHIIMLIDGKIESETIIADYEISGYTSRLEDEGYTQAYYVPLYQKMYDEALEELKRKERLLNIAKQNAAKVNEGDKKRLEKTIGVIDYD